MTECECGETMHRELAEEVKWAWSSPEFNELEALAELGLTVWNCWGCGEFRPVLFPDPDGG